MKLFISYSHKQAGWVKDTLVPVLEATNQEVLIDADRFKAGQSVIGQMDDLQNEADKTLLVVSKSYLESKICRHEMNRAITAHKSGEKEEPIVVLREKVDVPGELDQNMLAILTDDTKDEGWDFLLRGINATFNCTASHWLSVRKRLTRYLMDGASVNLITTNNNSKEWRKMIAELKDRGLIRQLDLMSGATVTRPHFVKKLLEVAGLKQEVPEKPNDLLALANAFSGREKAPVVAITHGGIVELRREEYDNNLFYAIRELFENRKLTLLFQSRVKGFRDLLPSDHILSQLDIKTLRLQHRST